MLGVRIRDAEVVGEEHAVERIDQVDNLNRVSINTGCELVMRRREAV